MRLAPRLVLAFGALSLLSVAGLGLVLREDRKQAETARFTSELKDACSNVTREVTRQAELDEKLVSNACSGGELVDRVSVVIARGDLDDNRLRFRELVPKQRLAYDFDELILATTAGDIIGADPRPSSAAAKDVAKELQKEPGYAFRSDGKAAIVARCRVSTKATAVGVMGVRYLEPLLTRLAKNQGVSVAIGGTQPALISNSGGVSFGIFNNALGPELTASCVATDKSRGALPMTVSRSTAVLRDNLDRLDRAVLLAALLSTGIAFVLSVLLARGLGRPLAELAREASKVARGDARPLKVSGSGEIRELVVSFDTMIEDLSITRQRLAAATRVAAWREVARRVAHEVKNPLAPIRAAVETLRRLRARQDPAFDDYFDEATRTVLDEVHRISNIVTEFTRFARLPVPKPASVDLESLLNSVVKMHQNEAIRLQLVVEKRPAVVLADRDQIVQVVTNLVQNATDAVSGLSDARVTVTLAGTADGDALIAVTDNGSGVDAAFAERLFEPYATTKAHGTGLGLAIAQRIAVEHRGDLSYMGPGESGRGSRFRLRLPPEGPPEAVPESV